MAVDILLLLLLAILVFRYGLRIKQAMDEDPNSPGHGRRKGQEPDPRIQWRGERKPRSRHVDAPPVWPRPDAVEEVQYRERTRT